MVAESYETGIMRTYSPISNCASNVANCQIAGYPKAV